MKVCGNVLLLFLAASTLASDNKDAELPCLLPPYPENGVYNGAPESAPGDRLEAVVLNVTCYRGYNLAGQTRVSCLSGYWDYDMPECLPYCKPGKESGVIACEANAPKCFITAANLPSFSSRTVSSDFNCGIVGPDTTRVISGGHPASLSDAPWHAGLYLKTTTPYKQICGGTLITKDVVVTAAHCFSQDGTAVPASNYAIGVGKLYRPWNDEHEKGAQKSDVQEVKLPPRYFGSLGNFQDDIAIVTVTKPFYFSEYVRPACVSFDRKFDEEQLRANNYGRVFGWGLVGENSKSSQTLLYTDMPYVDIIKCATESPLSFKNSITSDKFCAGYTNGTAVCRGDSGGGLVFPKKVQGVERYYLRGVVSTSPVTENACNIYSWAAFTHIQKHESFLKTVIGSAEEAPSAPDQPVSDKGSLQLVNANFYVSTKPPVYDGWI